MREEIENDLIQMKEGPVKSVPLKKIRIPYHH